MSAERVTYLDSSAIVKLVVREPESAALLRHLRKRRALVASALAQTEVARATMALGPAVRERAREVLQRLELIRVNDRVLRDAGDLLPVELRSLDAIHLATAALLGKTLAAVITYDTRMAEVARRLRFKVLSPA
jgi:predicted nucleic acid-binding protein